MNTTMARRHGGPTPLMTLDPMEIDQLPWWPVPECPGVIAKELWAAGDRHDALISYGAGCVTPGRSHPGAEHHIWVVSGSASIAGRHVVAGSYLHVPPGTAHPITAGPGGCLLLQMHRSTWDTPHPSEKRAPRPLVPTER
ncbi:cupin domain-containing protein [Actinoplanes sp. NPDC048967]|uniref:cupin domain-containing protein n=1 Tax=Actinoplanes sp. NPDC048967 TaxID=3155269 RepID=UPI0033E15948